MGCLSRVVPSLDCAYPESPELGRWEFFLLCPNFRRSAPRRGEIRCLEFVSIEKRQDVLWQTYCFMSKSTCTIFWLQLLLVKKKTHSLKNMYVTLRSLKPLTSFCPRVLGCRSGQFTSALKPSAAQRLSSAGGDFCGQGVCLYTLCSTCCWPCPSLKDQTGSRSSVGQRPGPRWPHQP